MAASANATIESLLDAAKSLTLDNQLELLRRLAVQIGDRSGTQPGPECQSTAQSLVKRNTGPTNPAQYDNLTYRIIGCALHVHNQLGSGHREEIYQRAMEEELALAGIPVVAQPQYAVYDTPLGGHLLGYYIPDIIAADQVIIELKALGSLNNQHVSQVIGYLKITGCPLGLLFNFGERRLCTRRILPPKNINAADVEHQWLFKPDGA